MRKKVVKKADLNTLAGRYFIAKKQYKTKKEAALQVGIDPRNTTQLESTQMYQAIEKKYFKDEFQNILSITQLAYELKKNVVQDEDRGAKNAAIKIALDKLEPDKVSANEENERVMVIIK